MGARNLFLFVGVVGAVVSAQALPTRLRSRQTAHLLDVAPHAAVSLVKKMNELGRLRGQYQTFLMPIEASATARHATEVSGLTENLRQEVRELSRRIEEVKADIQKDLSGLEDLLRKLKDSQKEGTADADGRGHELQLVIWKVGDTVSQVEEVLKEDAEQYKNLSI